MSGVTVGEPLSDHLAKSLHSFSRLLPKKVAVHLVQRMFRSGCDSGQLVQAIDYLWMGVGVSADVSAPPEVEEEEGGGQTSDGPRLEDRDDVIRPALRYGHADPGPGPGPADEQQWMKSRRLTALQAIETAVHCACLLRDGRGEDFDSHHSERFSVCAAELPSMINSALSPITATSPATAAATIPSSSSVQVQVQAIVLESCSCAIDASLLLVSASLRAMGQQQRISGLLQGIADYNTPPPNSRSETAVKSTDIDRPSTGSGRVQASSLSVDESARGAWTHRWTWTPNNELLAQVVSIAVIIENIDDCIAVSKDSPSSS